MCLEQRWLGFLSYRLIYFSFDGLFMKIHSVCNYAIYLFHIVNAHACIAHVTRHLRNKFSLPVNYR